MADNWQPDNTVPTPHAAQAVDPLAGLNAANAAGSARGVQPVVHGAQAQEYAEGRARVTATAESVSQTVAAANSVLPSPVAGRAPSKNGLIARFKIPMSVVKTPAWRQRVEVRAFALRVPESLGEWTGLIGQDTLEVVPQFIVEVAGQPVEYGSAQAWWAAIPPAARQLVCQAYLSITTPTEDEGKEMLGAVEWAEG